ncbi:RES domain-containing protein [Rubrivivax sp. JA1024]|nr:RES domain-containing protein [Rubrivivax sp. JA1024]
MSIIETIADKLGGKPVLGTTVRSQAELAMVGRESWTQQCGDAWHASLTAPLLRMPSAIVPIEGSPDLNVLINHRHPDAERIRIAAIEPFALDPRLF